MSIGPIGGQPPIMPHMPSFGAGDGLTTFGDLYNQLNALSSYQKGFQEGTYKDTAADIINAAASLFGPNPSQQAMIKNYAIQILNSNGDPGASPPIPFPPPSAGLEFLPISTYGNDAEAAFTLINYANIKNAQGEPDIQHLFGAANLLCTFSPILSQYPNLIQMMKAGLDLASTGAPLPNVAAMFGMLQNLATAGQGECMPAILDQIEQQIAQPLNQLLTANPNLPYQDAMELLQSVSKAGLSQRETVDQILSQIGQVVSNLSSVLKPMPATPTPSSASYDNFFKVLNTMVTQGNSQGQSIDNIMTAFTPYLSFVQGRTSNGMALGDALNSCSGLVDLANKLSGDFSTVSNFFDHLIDAYHMSPTDALNSCSGLVDLANKLSGDFSTVSNFFDSLIDGDHMSPNDALSVCSQMATFANTLSQNGANKTVIDTLFSFITELAGKGEANLDDFNAFFKAFQDPKYVGFISKLPLNDVNIVLNDLMNAFNEGNLQPDSKYGMLSALEESLVAMGLSTQLKTYPQMLNALETFLQTPGKTVENLVDMLYNHGWLPR